jgi:hypothetical protein
VDSHRAHYIFRHRPSTATASKRGNVLGTAATINRRRFDKAVVIVVRQVGRRTEQRWCKRLGAFADGKDEQRC